MQIILNDIKKVKLLQLAKMLLANGFSKEQIFKQTGIKL